MPDSSQVKLEIQKRYNRFAEEELRDRGLVEVVTRAKTYFRFRKLTTALAMGYFPSGAPLLELGCAAGQFSFPLARRGYRVTGLDLAANSIALAKRRLTQEPLGSLSFLAGDAERLDRFSDNSFSGVLSFSTLRYLPNLSLSLAEIYRVLQPKGQVVVDFPNRWCPWFYVKQWLGSEQHPHDHWWTGPQLRKQFNEAGFQGIQIQTILFTPTVTPDWLLPMFRWTDRWGERIPLMKHLAGILMIRAQKP